jgi:hypothetical protein
VSDICSDVYYYLAARQATPAELQLIELGPIRVVECRGNYAIRIGTEPDSVCEADTPAAIKEALVGLPSDRSE